MFSLLENPIVLWDEPAQVHAAADRFWTRLEQTEPSPAYDPDRVYFRWEELQRQAATAPQLELKELEIGWEDPRNEAIGHISTRPTLSFHGNMQVAIAEARNLVEKGNKVAFFASSSGEVERVADILNEYGVPYQLGLEQFDSTPAYLAERAYMAGTAANIYLVRGQIRHGSAFQHSNLVVFGSEDLFETSELIARGPAKKSAMETFSPDLIDLKPGDFVVHSEHGVAQYLGLREIAQGESQGDYMLLEYAAGAKLYVPLTRMDLVQRFRGGGESKPALDRMGGATWTRTKGRIKAKMRDMADELLKLYASRKMTEGFRFSPDSNWQREFEDAFEFNETRDQLTAIQEIKRDMEGPQPMDRLLWRGRRFWQDRSGHARRFQSSGRRQAGGHPGAHNRIDIPALRDLQTAVPALSGEGGDVQPLPHRKGDEGLPWWIWPKERSISPWVPTGCSRRTWNSATWAWWWWTKSNVSASSTKSD